MTTLAVYIIFTVPEKYNNRTLYRVCYFIVAQHCNVLKIKHVVMLFRWDVIYNSLFISPTHITDKNNMGHTLDDDPALTI